jgi:hypothetical protein
VAVVPLHPIAGGGFLPDHLLDDSGPLRTLGGLGLDLDAIPRLKLHLSPPIVSLVISPIESHGQWRDLHIWFVTSGS